MNKVVNNLINSVFILTLFIGCGSNTFTTKYDFERDEVRIAGSDSEMVRWRLIKPIYRNESIPGITIKRLSYLDTIDNAINLLYEEESNIYGNRPLREELYCPIEDSMIKCKGMRIKIIEATDKLLKYFVLKDSVPENNVQLSGNQNIYVGGGISFPKAHLILSDEWNYYFNGIVGVGFNLSNSISLNGVFIYNRYSKGLATIMSMMGEMKIGEGNISQNIFPYLLIGLGSLRFSIDDINISVGRQVLTVKGDSKYLFGANVGAGIENQISDDAFIFFEFRYFVGSYKKEYEEYPTIHLGFHFMIPYQR